jgi:hypothetical protein
MQRQPLAQQVRHTEVLLTAWHAIRRNGETSTSRRTREEVKEFGAELPRRLRSLQERLRKAPYQFAKQVGVTPEKAKGKGKRPLVVAPLADRIVQRAILDVLQDATELAGVQEVLATPTSIGGIRGRGVDHAIRLIEEARERGEADFVAGSDIAQFFTQIDKASVVDFIRSQTEDEEFIDLFKRALDVDLANAEALSDEDRAMFPTDDTGVAQGCPLSALAGNIALREFDDELNGRRVRCIRYIDDFAILGSTRAAVEKAYANAGKRLAALGMKTYQPNDGSGKAFAGKLGGDIEFLGYELTPGLYPPTKKNRERLIASVKAELDEGRRHILRAIHKHPMSQPLQRYAQSLVEVDRRVRAWSGSFKSSRCEATAREIDQEIDRLLSDFIAFYRDQTNGLATKTEKRRALGVHVVSDDIRLRNKHS